MKQRLVLWNLVATLALALTARANAQTLTLASTQALATPVKTAAQQVAASSLTFPIDISWFLPTWKCVHANGANPKNQALMRLEIPAAASLIEVETLGLPADWRDDETATQTIGNTWVASGASLGLWVPSFIEPGERNLLLNPAHPAYATVTLQIERHPFEFDPRLFIAPAPAAPGGTSP